MTHQLRVCFIFFGGGSMNLAPNSPEHQSFDKLPPPAFFLCPLPALQGFGFMILKRKRMDSQLVTALYPFLHFADLIPLRHHPLLLPDRYPPSSTPRPSSQGACREKAVIHKVSNTSRLHSSRPRSLGKVTRRPDRRSRYIQGWYL